MKKILILLIVAILLMSTPLAAANGKPPLTKIVFTYEYEEGFGKPPGTPGKGPGGGGGNDEGYELLVKGVKWKDLPVDYVIDPDNPDGLLEHEFVVSAISSGAEEWDDHTSAELFNDVYTVVYDATFDTDSPDGRNELLFGNYPQEGVIAVAIVWWSPAGRKIVEFDIMFDTDFTWGDAGDTSETALGDTSVMDLQNIATHELGHGAGLADLYDDQYSEQTMYGYATHGETKKRTLNTGDIAGIQALYG